MKKNCLFVSHSSKDGDCEMALRKGLENLGLEIRFDSCDGEPSKELHPETKQEIEEARAFIVVIGTETKSADRVVKETAHALEQMKKGDNDYKVIPLILEGVEPEAVTTVLGKEPVGMKIQIGSGGIDEAIPQILAALGERLSEEQKQSILASIGAQLRRISPEMREKMKPLGVFQGGGSISNITYVLKLNEAERDLLVKELLEIGLAEPMPYGFIRFHPALCPYLYQELDQSMRNTYQARWGESMRQLVEFLNKKRSEDTHLADSLTQLEQMNLLQMLRYVQAQDVPEVTMDLAVMLEELVAQLETPGILAKVTEIRKEEEKKSGEWGHNRFEVLRIQIERLMSIGSLPRALSVAQVLLDKCEQAGENSYAGADYDLAEAHMLLGRVLRVGGAAEDALKSIDEALRRFQLLADRGDSDTTVKMVAASLAKRGECLFDLGRFKDAAAAYEGSIRKAGEVKSERQIALAKGQLGMVRMSLGQYEESLRSHDEAREIFDNLGDPNMVAVACQQTGVVHEEIGQFDEAEQAYLQALAINVEQKNTMDEAKCLGSLGSFYAKIGRSEDAVNYFQRAAGIYREINDMANEGRVRGNLTITLIILKRYEEARREILRAIECFKPYGHNVEPWRAWDKLREIELAEGNQEAASRARKQSVQVYLACRRDGGEDQNPSARLCVLFEEALKKQKPEEVRKQLDEVANDPKIPVSGKLLVSKLQEILAGSRERELAEDLGLNYADAAEILFLLERLERVKVGV
ncbi:MAG: toll/interleukin-1 receptor domain-containing protein [Candidatus Scalindua sp.]|nr:toll/interleukin-1 receptor domain-containing protein [Candidatus Scalindua sp.]